MVIHHDKMAYGKLDSLSEKFSEEKLKQMAERLSRGDDGEKDGERGGKTEQGGAGKVEPKQAIKKAPGAGARAQ